MDVLLEVAGTSRKSRLAERSDVLGGRHGRPIQAETMRAQRADGGVGLLLKQLCHQCIRRDRGDSECLQGRSWEPASVDGADEGCLRLQCRMHDMRVVRVWQGWKPLPWQSFRQEPLGELASELLANVEEPRDGNVRARIADTPKPFGLDGSRPSQPE